ncbi:MAG: dipeptide transporter ATP-binding protein [Chloroflexi bacterium]|nr:dipeptide transporter ATP-binding protein [Chloroflexota bacterium]
MNAPLLEVRNLKRYFHASRTGGLLGGVPRLVRAVDDVSLTLEKGETLGLVGESGCGKSTLGRAMLRLIEPTSGQVLLDGQDIMALRGGDLRKVRQWMQMVFQDPYSSLNPRMRVSAILREPLDIFHIGTSLERSRRVSALLERVGLDASFARRFPHDLSGGQRQRVGIAAALALEPRVIVADEPVSALDVSVQAQILNLFHQLQRDLRLGIVFVAHNLDVVQHVSDRVAVMYLGKIVETAPTALLFAAPQHPYTQALLSAIPVADPSQPIRAQVLLGEVPSPIDPPMGCRFHPRCPLAEDICKRVEPALLAYGPGTAVACHVAMRSLGVEASSGSHAGVAGQGDAEERRS